MVCALVQLCVLIPLAFQGCQNFGSIQFISHCIVQLLYKPYCVNALIYSSNKFDAKSSVLSYLL